MVRPHSKVDSKKGEIDEKESRAVLMFSLLAVLEAYATPRRILVVGMGRPAEANKSSAESEANDAAQTNANNQCFGTIENNSYAKTYDLCLPQTDQDDNTTWYCSVNVKAACIIGQ